jgi:hypothetical protein
MTVMCIPQLGTQPITFQGRSLFVAAPFPTGDLDI